MKYPHLAIHVEQNTLFNRMNVRGPIMRDKKKWEVGVARVISSAQQGETCQILAALARIEAKLDDLLSRLSARKSKNPRTDH